MRKMLFKVYRLHAETSCSK